MPAARPRAAGRDPVFMCNYCEWIDVRNTLLATAVAATLTLATTGASAQSRGAATKEDVAAVQAQMQALTERLNRLETANSALQSENSSLKAEVERRDAETEYLKAQTRDLREEAATASNEISKVKGADWATKIKARGDLRYRHESIMTERVVGSGATATVEDAADRNRHRIRARLGVDARITDNVGVTTLLATGGDDPRSSNQTLGTSGTRKAIGVDMAYVDWKFAQGANLVLGKQPWPFWRPGQSFFFDSDYNAEGGAVKYEQGMLFSTAYGWWLTEQYNADPNLENSDANVFGLQAGFKFPLFGGETRVAAHYFDCGACQDNSPLYNNSANGNTTFRIGTGTTNYLTYDYEILELAAQVGGTLFDQPFAFWANYAQNLASRVEYDEAYGVGVLLGKASNPHTWEAGLFYQSIDQDALFGQFIDSDFADGKTDSEGWVLKAGYAPVRNITFNATYFMNTLDKDVGTELDYDRLQLDLNYRF